MQPSRGYWQGIRAIAIVIGVSERPLLAIGAIMELYSSAHPEYMQAAHRVPDDWPAAEAGTGATGA